MTTLDLLAPVLSLVALLIGAAVARYAAKASLDQSRLVTARRLEMTARLTAEHERTAQLEERLAAALDERDHLRDVASDARLRVENPQRPVAEQSGARAGGTVRVPSRRREDYVKIAGTDDPAEVDDFLGGHLIRQRFGDGTTEITVLITDPTLGAPGDLVRLTNTDNTFTALLILLFQNPESATLYGKITPGNDTALDELTVTRPFPITRLTPDDLPLVTTSVRWSNIDAANAWDAAARTVHNPDLDEAIDRGIEQS